jgi:hypothetical protein
MCATCGCGQPENKHGDSRNITVSEFRASSTATKVAPGSHGKALRNTKKTLKMRRK